MLKVLIVDDEPQALMALRGLLHACAVQVQLVGEAGNALDGIKLIQRHRPDVVLLDIEMPHGSGFDLLDAFPERTFQVVFTTAHEQHAIRAAHTHPFDYLLKPVDPDELDRVLNELITSKARQIPDRIELTSLHGKVFLRVDEILRIEADGGYSTLHTLNGEKHLASKAIGHFEQLLPADRFFRCHQSHLVQLAHVRRYLNQDGGMVVLSDGANVPVATRRQSELLERLG
jgi:two-component system LytT family response regulator